MCQNKNPGFVGFCEQCISSGGAYVLVNGIRLHYHCIHFPCDYNEMHTYIQTYILTYAYMHTQYTHRGKKMDPFIQKTHILCDACIV